MNVGDVGANSAARQKFCDPPSRTGLAHGHVIGFRERDARFLQAVANRCREIPPRTLRVDTLFFDCCDSPVADVPPSVPVIRQ